MASTIHRIAAEHSGQLSAHIAAPLKYPYHTRKVFRDHPSLLALLNRWELDGRNYCEVGRLTLYNGYRTTRFALSFIEFAIQAACHHAGYDAAVIAADVEHQGVYRKFGFETLPGLGRFPYLTAWQAGMWVERERIHMKNR